VSASAPSRAGAAAERTRSGTLALRERFRDAYARERDPIADDRATWRAQTFRHMVHLLPGETILELGCGDGRFTRELLAVSRGRNPITAVGFDERASFPPELERRVEHLRAPGLPGPLWGRTFDHVVALDLLDARDALELVRELAELVRPGGELFVYASNPKNPVLLARQALARLARRPDPRRLPTLARLAELLEAGGFETRDAVYNDFVYAPLTRKLIALTRNLSILLENAPVVRATAGSILILARRPPEPAGAGERRRAPRPRHPSLARHEAFRGQVSVVVPCHDEETNVGPLVRDLLAFYGEYVHEVVLVDDCSRDGTPRAIAELAASDARVRGLARRPPPGVGRALGDGLRATRGRWVLTLDCDFQRLLPELEDLFDAAAAGAEVVVGSRFSRHSVLLNYPFAKIVANRGFHTLARLLLGRRLRDLTNNMKLMRREAVEALVLREPGFAANAEIGLEPLLSGFRVSEVPISWIRREPGMGTSSFRLARVGGGYARVLWGLWLRRAFGIGAYRELALARDAYGRPATGLGLERGADAGAVADAVEK
jgi:SAM-dependent methyltransferase